MRTITTPEPWRQGSYGDVAELVPVALLKRYREFARSRDAELGNRTPEMYDELTADLAANGIQDPLILEFNPRNGLALLGEGNNRLAIAEELGWSHVPVRVYRAPWLTLDRYPQARRVPGSKPTTGYVPADLRPSQVFSSLVVSG